MTKRNFLLAGLAIALAVAYTFYFTNWFHHQTIKVFHTSRSLRFRNRPGQQEPMLIFGFDRDYNFTDVQVVPLGAWESNHYALPVWHLTSDSNSPPVKSFFYGQRIHGMKPAVTGGQPQELETNVTYRLFVAAGPLKGQHDFHLGGPSSDTNPATPPSP